MRNAYGGCDANGDGDPVSCAVKCGENMQSQCHLENWVDLIIFTTNIRKTCNSNGVLHENALVALLEPERPNIWCPLHRSSVSSSLSKCRFQFHEASDARRYVSLEQRQRASGRRVWCPVGIAHAPFACRRLTYVFAINWKWIGTKWFRQWHRGSRISVKRKATDNIKRR